MICKGAFSAAPVTAWFGLSRHTANLATSRTAVRSSGTISAFSARTSARRACRRALSRIAASSDAASDSRALSSRTTTSTVPAPSRAIRQKRRRTCLPRTISAPQRGRTAPWTRHPPCHRRGCWPCCTGTGFNPCCVGSGWLANRRRGSCDGFPAAAPARHRRRADRLTRSGFRTK